MLSSHISTRTLLLANCIDHKSSQRSKMILPAAIAHHQVLAPLTLQQEISQPVTTHLAMLCAIDASEPTTMVTLMMLE